MPTDLGGGLFLSKNLFRFFSFYFFSLNILLYCLRQRSNADVAQLVEHLLGKEKVSGPIPDIGSIVYCS